ncbi:MAG: type III secretion system export apparatus subunit SctR [Desulfovibrio sp.]|jgi:type III secretion protein R|nr:type III secretion system export apparatus subunit SctR [Desulfovibrio sp.]
MQAYDPVLVIGALLLLGLAPFVIMVATSYLKLVVVLSLVRNALGVQQVPPNMVLNGLAVIFSVFIMAPVAFQTQKLLPDDLFSRSSTPSEMFMILDNAKGPMQEFMTRHAHQGTVNFFLETARRVWPEEKASTLVPTNLIILIPAFAVSELTRAFEIGFLIYLPFVTIDIVVSNILLAMGMMMVSPMVISLPFKLLLFVILDGWGKLIQALVSSYL